jgi:glycosyltransferase involved in cell wall biosynthesis
VSFYLSRKTTPNVVPVTAIVPCFNAGPLLRRSLDSIFIQSRTIDEVIVVDDGSTDGSAAVAAEYPVRLLRHERNRGASAARNAGLRAATHDLIAWLDADDCWDPEHCETVVPLLIEHPTAAVAFGRARFEGRADRVPWGQSGPCPGPVSFFWDSLLRCAVPIMAAVARRGPMLEIGGFRESLPASVDFDLWLRLSLTQLFVWTPDVTATYRWRQTSSQISSNRAAQRVALWQSRLLVWDQLRRSGHTCADEMRGVLADLWVRDLAIRWHNRELDEISRLLHLPSSRELDGTLTGRVRRFLAPWTSQ